MYDLLGLCIPTYRRPKALQECLRSIVLSAGHLKVPIFVSDDSTDDTNVAVIQQIQAEYPWVVHYRNISNLGIDRNIVQAADICDCRYAWLMGEDDRLQSDAVPKVVHALHSSPDIHFFFVNYLSIDGNMRIILRKRALDLRHGERFPAEEFLRRHGWAAGFLGACVVHKESWSGVNREKHIGTYFAHVGTIFEYLAGESVSVIADPVVMNRSGSPETFTWSENTFSVLDGWSLAMDLLQPYYDKKVCEEAKINFIRAHGFDSLYFLLYLRAGSNYDWTIFQEKVRKRFPGLIKRLAAAGIAVMPRFPLKLAGYLLNKMRGMRHGIVKPLA